MHTQHKNGSATADSKGEKDALQFELCRALGVQQLADGLRVRFKKWRHSAIMGPDGSFQIRRCLGRTLIGLLLHAISDSTWAHLLYKLQALADVFILAFIHLFHSSNLCPSSGFPHLHVFPCSFLCLHARNLFARFQCVPNVFFVPSEFFAFTCMLEFSHCCNILYF